MTFAGYFAIFFLLAIVINKGFKSITDPLFCMNVIFIFFFGIKQDVELTEKSELLLFLSFIIFTSTAYIISKRPHKRIIGFINNKNAAFHKFNIKPLRSKQQFYLFLIVLLYVILDFSFNTWLYGSFDKAATRFYYRLPEKENVPTFLTIIIFSLYSLSSLILFVLSYNNARFKTNSLYLNLSFFALALAAFPRGTRGAIISLLIIIILANIIVSIKNKKLVIKSLFLNVKLLFPASIVFLSFLALSSIRNKEIDNLEMLQKTIAEMDFSESQKEYNSAEGDLLLIDYNKCIETFGSSVSFLPLNYTLKAVLFNPIPRSIWKQKPVGFGVALTEVKFGGQNFDYEYLADFKWSNAAGIAGEGWANEGILGLILYSFLMGLYAGLLTKIVNTFLLSDNYVSLLIALLCFLASLLAIRGDILSAITQGLYPILFFIVILTILQPFVKYNYKIR
ncbi:hypothetical protein [Chryseobacterium oryctis]|uniref:Oligosaccharide repeat unit polymerase n=1 Tax=Chryseobacterium oryctis TaxID=2952618 RepID=A0ABT3HJA7_9FLAO|nr:hypothetical protein [Chryseobacterium oryctis]MCW3159871.1 hypothetical protein [Chryseobacterium oryctis]